VQENVGDNMKNFFAGLILFVFGAVNWHVGPAYLRPFTKPVASVIPKHNNNNSYTLYFTIDDGPLEGTPFIDSVFREEKVPADLFIVGTHVYQDRIFTHYLKELEKNKWFTFNNHSYTHANEDYEYYYAHPKMVLHDMRRNNDSLHFANNICRMPARNMWRLGGKKFNDGFSGNRAASLLKRKGFAVIGWDEEWEADLLNHPVQSADSLFKQLQTAFTTGDSFVPGHVVLLCHDWMFTRHADKEQLEAFIRLVKSAGNIKFEWLKNYPLYRKG
jgi:peptidoglycan/xylan/chitin deacetylase (PgdA/CDA1 family)